MYDVQICFRGRWTTIYGPFPSRDDAEWAIGQWKQAASCRGDDVFRVVQVPGDGAALTPNQQWAVEDILRNEG